MVHLPLVRGAKTLLQIIQTRFGFAHPFITTGTDIFNSSWQIVGEELEPGCTVPLTAFSSEIEKKRVVACVSLLRRKWENIQSSLSC